MPQGLSRARPAGVAPAATEHHEVSAARIIVAVMLAILAFCGTAPG
jgi:hypothetical protein